MLSINYYLSVPFKEGINKNDIKEYKRKGKSNAKLLNDKPTQIYLFLTFPGRKLMRFNIMEKIKATQWDFENKMAKSSMYGCLELNDRLQFLKAEIIRNYRKAITENPKITLVKIRELVERVVADKLPDFTRKPFLACMDEFILERSTTLHPLTTKKYKSVMTVIRTWMESVDIEPADFFCEQIDNDFDHSFKQYLMLERKIVNQTISKYLECIKAFMRWARKKNYHSSNIFEEFTIKRSRKEVIWLTEDEVELIKKYKPEDSYMVRVKLSFLFMIYTAQRYSDIRNLKRRDLVISPDGLVDWNLFQLKGSRSQKIIIPLLQAAVDLLDQLNFRTMLPDDFVIPIGCNQWMNRAIKIMCKDAGITTPVTVVRVVAGVRSEKSVQKCRLISCHTARRTFVSISSKNNLNFEYLTSITGHSSHKTMRLYLGLNHESKREALTQAWSTEKSMPEVGE